MSRNDDDLPLEAMVSNKQKPRRHPTMDIYQEHRHLRRKSVYSVASRRDKDSSTPIAPRRFATKRRGRDPRFGSEPFDVNQFIDKYSFIDDIRQNEREKLKQRCGSDPRALHQLQKLNAEDNTRKRLAAKQHITTTLRKVEIKNLVETGKTPYMPSTKNLERMATCYLAGLNCPPAK